MTKDRIKEVLKNCIIENYNILWEDITDETNFEQDLAMDSLDHIELVMRLEKKFGIQISDEEYSKWPTVSLAVEGLSRMLGNNDDNTDKDDVASKSPFVGVTPNELMYGDFVKCGDTLVRITRVSEKSASGLDIEALEPIPLTVEILEKHGFRQEIDGAYTWYDGVHTHEQVYVAVNFRRDGTVRRIDILNHGVHFSKDILPYGIDLHIFQHILRLCDFNELADRLR